MLGAWQEKAARNQRYDELLSRGAASRTSLNILLSFVTVYENKTPTSMHPVFHAVQTVINHQGQFPADTLTGL